jgi:hypothetical protein
MAAGRAGVRLIEGDGWVNWSALATALRDMAIEANQLVEHLFRSRDTVGMNDGTWRRARASVSKSAQRKS